MRISKKDYRILTFLEAIKEQMNISQLAEELETDVGNLHRNLTKLADVGLVEFYKPDDQKGNVVYVKRTQKHISEVLTKLQNTKLQNYKTTKDKLQNTKNESDKDTKIQSVDKESKNNGDDHESDFVEIDSDRFFEVLKEDDSPDGKMLNNWFFNQKSKSKNPVINEQYTRSNENRYQRIAIFTINRLNKYKAKGLL